MTFKEFHILNENKIEDFINSVNDTDLKKELKEALKSSIIAVQGDKFKININNKDLEKFVDDNKKELGLELDSLKKSSISRDKLIQIVFDGNEKEFNNTIVNTDESKSGKSNLNQSNGDGNGGSPVEGSIKKDSGKQKTEPGDEKIVDNFFANKDFIPKVSNNYSSFKIEGSNFLQKSLNLNDYGILYSAIKNFGIKPEHIKEIKEIVSLLKDAAEKDSDSKLSLEEYVSAMKKLSTPTNANGAGKSLAKEPNIVKFVLFLAKLHTIHNENFPTASRIIPKETVKRFLTDKNDATRKENESLLYSFFTINNNGLAPNISTIFGEILSELSKFDVSFQLDDVLNDKMSTLKQIDDFVQNPPEAKPEEKRPEKEGLASRVRGQYLSKRITDNKRNLDRYDRETEKLKDVSYGYNKKADENQAGKIASRETYGFDIDKPTADEDSIKNFRERIKHLIQNDLLNITGALRIKGIAGDRSEANRKNNAISRTWEEAIMRSNNKTLMEGFRKNRIDDLKYAWHDTTKAISPFQKFRGLTDNSAKSKNIDKDTGEYVSNAEERANKIFKYYMQRSNELIDRYVEKMENASRKVETGKTYAQRVNKEWGITKAYYDLLRELFDLKLACRKDCEEGGIAKALKGIRREIGERVYGDKEYREKNAISNADAVKKMLEKQLLNVQPENDNQTIAKLYLYNILFNSKSANDAINSINNGNFSGLGLDNVKDYTNVTTSGIRVDLLKPSKVYNKPADLFRSIGINPKEITEDGLTQLQKSLNKEDCIAKVNEFKNFFGNVKSKITPAASISFEELFRKNGFVIKEESQEVINARNLVANELKNGIDLTDIVKKINLAEHSIKTAAFKQAIAGNVLLNGFENGEKVYKLFNSEQFAKVKSEQSKYKQAIEKDQQMQQNNVQQPQQTNQQVNNNQTDDKSDLENAKDYAGAPKSVVTTNAVDSTYGNGYQKQTPQSRMKEIIYKKGNYTVKTRQMI